MSYKKLVNNNRNITGTGFKIASNKQTQDQKRKQEDAKKKFTSPEKKPLISTAPIQPTTIVLDDDSEVV